MRNIGSGILLMICMLALSCCKAPMTLNLSMTDGAYIPVQSGRPMISFEPQDRPVINLAGQWKKKRFEIDHDFSLSPRTSSWFASIEKESAGAYRIDFNDSSWESHTVPGVENIMPPTPDNSNGPELYEGGIYYRRPVFVPSAWNGKTIRMISLGADYIADLWVNGKWIGYHEGGYSPFSFDITDNLVYGGENVIFFRIDAMEWKLRQDILPTYFETDWMHYAGLVQDVYLEAAPSVNVVRADVIPRDISGDLDVSVIIENNSSTLHDLTARLRVFEINRNTPGYLSDPVAAHLTGREIGISEQAEETAQLPANHFTRKGFLIKVPNPALWSPANPNLYVLKAELVSCGSVIDSFSTQFGFRTVAVGEGAKMLINGQPAFFTGMARHEDWPDSGRTAMIDKIRRDLQIIKDTNVNFLRSGHYPNHPYTYILTDRMGLAVWEEIPAWWINSVSIDRLTSRGLPKQMFREMCFSERNRPSVILWSVCNEPMYYLVTTEKLRGYVKALHDDLDLNYPDGRLVTFSLAADGVKTTGGAIEAVDVAGFTMYYGVFYGSLITQETMKFLQDQHELYPDKPIIACEFGTWPGSKGRGEMDQVIVARETLDGLLPLAAVDEQGHATDEFLASAVWWCQFNWYRINREAPVQSMGITMMDRITHKEARNVLKEIYKPYFDMGGIGR
jgi:beta-galactosidase